MALGTPVSNKFQIGNAEIRIGAMTNAGKLTQANSVGLLQSATVNFNQESVDLEAGLPKTLVDTVITKTNVTVSAQAYEFSRKNIRTMINLAQESVSATEYSGTIAASYTVGTTATEFLETDIALGDVNVGDLLVVYPDGSPEKVSVVRVTAKAARTAPNAAYAKVTIDGTKTPMLFNAAIGDKVYKANQLGLGSSNATNYFTMDVLGVDHNTGRPMGFRFWKCAVAGGMEFAFSNDNFAVTPLQFKILMPAASEYGAGGSLITMADLIPSHPFGMYFAG